jgi:hypothetical protein
MLHLCPECLGETDFICEGHDSDWKKFRLYRCPNCKSHVREFDAPPKEATLKVALRTDALSDKPVQMRMFPKGRVTD